MSGFRTAESLAVAFSLGYTLLLTYGSLWAWPCALVASVLFFELTRRRKIYAEAFLHLFYGGTAIWGWVHWLEEPGFLQLAPAQHLYLMLGCGVAMVLLGFALKRWTGAALPYLDAFTTVFSMAATLLMVWAVPENWIYWVVIDAVSVGLYLKRGMPITAGLFLLYTALAVNGYLEWTTA